MSASFDIKRKTAEKLGVIARFLNVSVDDLLRTYVPGFVSGRTTRGGTEVDPAFHRGRSASIILWILFILSQRSSAGN